MNIIVNGKAVELEEGSRALEAAKAHSPTRRARRTSWRA